jgi:L-malate glycosyltransferase
MRIALVTPTAFPAVGGNAVTVARLGRGLRERGMVVDTLDLSRTPPSAVDGRLDAFRPEVVHAFHAFRGGAPVRRYARARRLPLVISLTGTDANIDLVHPERRAETIASIGVAAALVAFHETIRTRVAREVPGAAARIEVIAQSVRLDETPGTGWDLVPRGPGEVRFLLPAGIRKVKNVLFPLGPLGRLAARYPIRLFIVGPVIEADEGARLREALEGQHWAAYLGEVPHPQMAALLDRCDVVVNSSLSEGGMANSVLEAMARGKPVLASDVEGNRSVIEPEEDGVLYAGDAQFERQAERLVRDPALRARLGAAGRGKIERCFAPGREVDAYLALYRRLIRSDPDAIIPAWR